MMTTMMIHKVLSQGDRYSSLVFIILLVRIQLNEHDVRMESICRSSSSSSRGRVSYIIIQKMNRIWPKDHETVDRMTGLVNVFPKRERKKVSFRGKVIDVKRSIDSRMHSRVSSTTATIPTQRNFFFLVVVVFLFSIPLPFLPERKKKVKS